MGQKEKIVTWEVEEELVVVGSLSTAVTVDSVLSVIGVVRPTSLRQEPMSSLRPSRTRQRPCLISWS